MRLLVHVEGETEETFSNEILRPHLVEAGYHSVDARIIGNARQRSRRGGIRGWPQVKQDIVRHLRQDDAAIATTMVDYYALPLSGQKAWPGRAEAAEKPFHERAAVIEAALLADVKNEMGSSFDVKRFVPFVVMHEFEGLLFSDCAGFAKGIGRPDLAPDLSTIRNQFTTPEEINDSPITAPSKRIEQLIPEYQKPIHGNVAALEVGLKKIKEECPHFKGWLNDLEKLAMAKAAEGS